MVDLLAAALPDHGQRSCRPSRAPGGVGQIVTRLLAQIARRCRTGASRSRHGSAMVVEVGPARADRPRAPDGSTSSDPRPGAGSGVRSRHPRAAEAAAVEVDAATSRPTIRRLHRRRQRIPAAEGVRDPSRRPGGAPEATPHRRAARRAPGARRARSTTGPGDPPVEGRAEQGRHGAASTPTVRPTRTGRPTSRCRTSARSVSRSADAAARAGRAAPGARRPTRRPARRNATRPTSTRWKRRSSTSRFATGRSRRSAPPRTRGSRGSTCRRRWIA